MFLYIIGMGLLPCIGWAVNSYITQRDISRKLDRVLDMHIAGKTLIEEQTRVLGLLVHYIKWLEVKNKGEEPPPPLGG